MRTSAFLIGLAACGASAPSARHPTTYRAQTVTADAIGVTALTLGLVEMHHEMHSNADEPMVAPLLATGVVVTALGDSVIHLAHGHPGRAVGTLLLRVGTVASGTLFGMSIHGCDFDCAEGMLWGAAAGLAAGTVIDALVMHFPAESTWTPTVTPSDGGARVGLATPF